MASESGTERCVPCQDALAFYFIDMAFIRSGDFQIPYDFVALEKSAVGGCDLCRILYQALVYTELSESDLRNSTDLVCLSSDTVSLTIQLRCRDSRGRRVQVSNVLWSKRPELSPSGRHTYRSWDPSDCRDESQLLNDIDYVCPQILRWFKECECTPTFHKLYDSLQNLPTRLIDVGPADGSTPPHLRIMNGYEPWNHSTSRFDESQFPPWSYLTLSYCWGKQPASIGTTKANFRDRTKSIPIDSLPKTIRDAIIITRKMGVRFLWADVLCIIQPTELDNSDWVQESVRMGDYYKGSLFTIAAASASDSAEGCLFSRKGLRFPQRACFVCTLRDRVYYFSHLKDKQLFRPATERKFRIPHSRIGGVSTKKFFVASAVLTGTFAALGSIGMVPSKDVFAPENIPYDKVSINPCLPSACHVVDKSPLFTRGWVLQELLLSTRVVFWTKDVLYWNCREKFVSEHRYDCNRYGVYASRWSRDMQLMRSRPCWDRESALIRWTSVIQRFSSMNLSVPRDTLPAISAIAKGIQAMFPDDYLAGHWRQSLVESLAWVSIEKPGAIFREAGHHWELENYVAPSWSWASVSSFRRISFRFIRREFRRDVELIAASTQLATVDPTGMVSAGSISLRGTMTEIAFCSEQFPTDLDVHYWTESNHKAEIFLEVPVDPRIGVTCFLLGHLDLEGDEYDARGRKAYTGILFLVLLLEPTNQVPDQYRRVGLGVLSKERWFGSEGVKTTIEVI